MASTVKQYDNLIICHLFYKEESLEILEKLLPLRKFSSFFLFNIGRHHQARKELTKFIRKNFSASFITQLPSKGRDIGAKLRLIDLAMNLGIQSQQTLIIHDKKSPHLPNGSHWREGLLRIIEKSKLDTVFRLFRENNEIGIVCSSDYVQNEYNEFDHSFSGTSGPLIRQTLNRHHIDTITNYDFVAGNIFWIRTALLDQFFTKVPLPEVIGSLEQGNAVDFNKGTYIHAWERIMSWIASSQMRTIYGI